MYFFVIDRARNMHRIESVDRQCAYEDFNDKHKIIADLILDAEPCPHGKYILPKLPPWMEYNADSSCKICYVCSHAEDTTPPAPEAVEKPFVNQGNSVMQFFKHNKENEMP